MGTSASKETARLATISDVDTSADTQRTHVASSTSQGFQPPASDAELRKGVRLAIVGGACGAFFFAAIQGSIFNFYIEDLGLKDKLGVFMGLASLASLGSLFGSWFIGRYGHRKGVLLTCMGGSRLIWLLIGAIPLLWPELRGEDVFWPLIGLLLLFFVSHAAGMNAWLSWMADLVPSHMHGSYFALRQVFISIAAVAGRFAFGWFLDANRNPNGYMTVYIVAVIIGLANAVLYMWVVHRPVKRTSKDRSLIQELRETLGSAALRRFTLVYMLWMFSNCVVGATVFRFARAQVGLGVFELSVTEVLAMSVFAVFSFLWGRLSDHHGHRGPLVVCLLVHSFCPVFYFFAGPGDWYLVALGFSVGALGFCGVNLYMLPMLMNFTTRKGGDRAVGIAAFTSLLGLTGFAVFWLTDDVLRPLIMMLSGASELDSLPVFLTLFALGSVLRLGAAFTAWRMPAGEMETEPGIVVRMFAFTNPLRAAMHGFRYVTTGVRNGEIGPLAVPERVRVLAERAAGMAAPDRHGCGRPAPLHDPDEERS